MILMNWVITGWVRFPRAWELWDVRMLFWGWGIVCVSQILAGSDQWMYGPDLTVRQTPAQLIIKSTHPTTPLPPAQARSCGVFTNTILTQYYREVKCSCSPHTSHTFSISLSKIPFTTWSYSILYCIDARLYFILCSPASSMLKGLRLSG